MAGSVVHLASFQSGAAAQQRHEPDLTTALFNEGILLATSLFMVALCACPSSGLCRGVGPLNINAEK